MARRFDATVFGATGFTGRLIALHIARTQQFPANRLCLAGRSKEKLESVREEMRAIDGQYGVTELLAASVESPPQVAAMVEMTRVVINCVGPFGVYGEIVVRECASQGTHYVDITGETKFIAEMIDKYDEVARRNGATIIPACGFDSIPADCGALYTYQTLSMEDEVKGVEGLVSSRGQSMSYGTWNTIMSTIMTGNSADVLKDAQERQAASRNKNKVLLGGIRYSKEAKKWLLPQDFACDKFTTQRTFDLLDKQSVEYTHNLGVRKLWMLSLYVIVFVLFRVLTYFTVIRNLLKRIKGPGTGPSDDARAKSSFQISFYAYSAKKKYLGSCFLKGQLDAYDFTAVSASFAAKALLDEDNIKFRGVVSPGAALGDDFLTRLVGSDDRLTLEGHPAVE